MGKDAILLSYMIFSLSFLYSKNTQYSRLYAPKLQPFFHTWIICSKYEISGSLPYQPQNCTQRRKTHFKYQNSAKLGNATLFKHTNVRIRFKAKFKWPWHWRVSIIGTTGALLEQLSQQFPPNWLNAWMWLKSQVFWS